jgi:hypothetical protein
MADLSVELPFFFENCLFSPALWLCGKDFSIIDANTRTSAADNVAFAPLGPLFNVLFFPFNDAPRAVCRRSILC